MPRCPLCSRSVEQGARICPHCGYELGKNLQLVVEFEKLGRTTEVFFGLTVVLFIAFIVSTSIAVLSRSFSTALLAIALLVVAFVVAVIGNSYATRLKKLMRSVRRPPR